MKFLEANAPHYFQFKNVFHLSISLQIKNQIDPNFTNHVFTVIKVSMAHDSKIPTPSYCKLGSTWKNTNLINFSASLFLSQELLSI